MSFLFALLQLVTFASVDNHPTTVARDVRDQQGGLEVEAPSKSDTFQRPIVASCVGTTCR